MSEVLLLSPYGCGGQMTRNTADKMEALLLTKSVCWGQKAVNPDKNILDLQNRPGRTLTMKLLQYPVQPTTSREHLPIETHFLEAGFKLICWHIVK